MGGPLSRGDSRPRLRPPPRLSRCRRCRSGPAQTGGTAEFTLGTLVTQPFAQTLRTLQERGSFDGGPLPIFVFGVLERRCRGGAGSTATGVLSVSVPRSAMSLASLLLTADGSPAERARLADVQIEILDLLTGAPSEEAALSPTLRLASVRQAMAALHRWCPSLREAEKVAAENALCLASAALGLDRILGSVEGGPDLSCDHSRSWDQFFFDGTLDSQDRKRLLQALDIKRDLLSLTAALEREADSAEIDRNRRLDRARVEKVFADAASLAWPEPVSAD